MTPTSILSQARTEGLALLLDQPDTIVVRGEKAVRAQWLPLIRQHKPELLGLLQSANEEGAESTPRHRGPCGACHHLLVGQCRYRYGPLQSPFVCLSYRA
ncbi:hypothetical protein CCP3SC15_120039 [Gammaproteobacteria bacterium]